MSNLKEAIRKVVKQIVIKKKGTREGDAQREAFRIRWGVKPDDL